MRYDFSIIATARLSNESINSIKAQLREIGKQAGVKIDSTPIKNTGKALQDATKNSNIFGQSLGNVAKKIVGWTAMTGVIFGVIHALKDGVQAVVDLDTALVELRKVTSLTADGLRQVTIQASAIGEEVARTTTDVIRATSDFARMGYSVRESLNLAKQAEMLVNIGDNIGSVDEATAAIIATLKGFNMSADETSSILDKLNEVSNRYAVDTSDLVNGITKVSATLGMSGNSLDQTIAMITAATEVLRDSGRASIGLRTIALRLRGVSEEGENLSDLVPKLKDEFDSIGISLLDSNNNFRSTYDILTDLSKVWGDLTDLEQSNLTYLIAGTRQSDVLNSVLINNKTLIDANTTSQESMGSALKENTIYMDSIKAKTELFSKAAQDLWINAINSDTIKDLVDFGTGLIKIADGFGLVNTAITVLGGIILSKYIPTMLSATGITNAFTVAVASAPPVLLALGSMAIIAGIIALSNAISGMNLTLSNAYNLLNKNKLKTDENIAELKDLASSYESLAKKESKNAEDKKNLLNIQTILNTKYGEAFKGTNLYTDAINLNSDAIDRNIQLMKDKIKIEAENFIKLNDLYYQQAKNFSTSKYNVALGEQLPMTWNTPAESLEYMAQKIEAGVSSWQPYYDELYQKINDAQNIIIEYEGYINELNSLDTPDLTAKTENLVDSFEKIKYSLSDILTDSNFKSEIESLLDVINDWRSSNSDIETSVQSLADTLNITTEEVTENISLITAYVKGDKKAFEEAFNAQLKLYNLKPSTGGIVGAMSTIVQAANKGSSAVRSLITLLLALGKVEKRQIVTGINAITGKPVYATIYTLPANAYAPIDTNSGGGGGGGSSKPKISGYLESLKNSLESQNDLLDSQIDKKQELLDDIKEQYQTEDMILKVQEAQANLLNTQKEKNMRLYNAQTGKFDWVADPRAVREAQKAYDDANKDYSRYQSEKVIEDQIEVLEKQQDAIKDFMDAIDTLVDKGVGNQIKSWNQLIAKLNEVGIAYQDISGYIGVGNTAELKASQTTGVLNSGSTGEGVKAVQRALLALGYYSGAISGSYDTAVKNAVKAFQKASGLSADGVVGNSTRSKFGLKGYKDGGGVYQTAPIMAHGTELRPEYMHSAPAVESIMGSVPAILAQMASGGGGDHFYINEMNVTTKDLGGLVQQMKNVAALGTRVPAR